MIAALLFGLFVGFLAGMAQGALSERQRVAKLLTALSRVESERQDVSSRFGWHV